jgi:hypothetical protein
MEVKRNEKNGKNKCFCLYLEHEDEREDEGKGRDKIQDRNVEDKIVEGSLYETETELELEDEDEKDHAKSPSKIESESVPVAEVAEWATHL